MADLVHPTPQHLLQQFILIREKSMLRNSLLLLTALALLVTFQTQAFAQSITSGDVTGNVTDPSGAAVPGDTVTLTNVATNSAQKSTTNGAVSTGLRSSHRALIRLMRAPPA